MSTIETDIIKVKKEYPEQIDRLRAAQEALSKKARLFTKDVGPSLEGEAQEIYDAAKALRGVLTGDETISNSRIDDIVGGIDDEIIGVEVSRERG